MSPGLAIVPESWIVSEKYLTAFMNKNFSKEKLLGVIVKKVLV